MAGRVVEKTEPPEAKARTIGLLAYWFRAQEAVGVTLRAMPCL
jgi:hypothetical protein